MFKSLKKFLVLIPCMILGIFLFNGVKTLAAEAVLMDSKEVSVGQEKYYFTNNSSWEFKAKFSAIKEWDTFLKWRVVNPSGKATAWSGKDYYVDNDGKFIVGDYKRLSYTEDVGLSGRSSIAPLMTYYVDIEYYGQLVVSWHQEEKDETIKVIVSGDNDSLNTPDISITYASSRLNITASVLSGGKGYGAITSVEYFFSTSTEDVSSSSKFYRAMNAASTKGSLSFTVGSSVSGSVTKASGANYFYVMAKTGNDYYAVESYSFASSQTNPNPGTTPGNPNPGQTGGQVDPDDQSQNPTADEGDSGIFNYEFGELILIMLVIVLIVSCALIITQKIVDYKKRLY